VSLTLTPADDRFPVRVWSADATTGTILGEVVPMSGSTWSAEFSGGACDATFDLNLPLKDGTGWDWAAVTYVRGLLAPWKRTLVVTQGTACLGEWLLTKLTPVDATKVQVSGVGWEQYPASRAVKQKYKWASGTDQMKAARTLLLDALSGITFTIPTATDSTQNVTADDRFDAWSTDYGQALEQVCDTDNGLEWAVSCSVAWVAGVPTTVTRTIVWGFPEIARTSILTARRPVPGERGGNVSDFSRPVDAARLVTKAVVLGRHLAGRGLSRGGQGLHRADDQEVGHRHPPGEGACQDVGEASHRPRPRLDASGRHRSMAAGWRSDRTVDRSHPGRPGCRLWQPARWESLVVGSRRNR